MNLPPPLWRVDLAANDWNRWRKISNIWYKLSRFKLMLMFVTNCVSSSLHAAVHVYDHDAEQKSKDCSTNNLRPTFYSVVSDGLECSCCRTSGCYLNWQRVMCRRAQASVPIFSCKGLVWSGLNAFNITITYTEGQCLFKVRIRVRIRGYGMCQSPYR